MSVPWFRFTLMDLALRVLFHRFQTIFKRIRLTFSVATELNQQLKCNQIQLLYTSSSSARTNIFHILLERTIEYYTYPASKFHVKRIQCATSEIESAWKGRPKFTWPANRLTCSPRLITRLSYQFTGCDMPLQKLSGMAIFVSLQECGFFRI